MQTSVAFYGIDRSRPIQLSLMLLLIMELVLPASGAAPPGESTSQYSRMSASRIKQLRRAMKSVAELHQPMEKPQAGDWLASFPEKGQTFAEYLRCQPTLPDANRSTIYIQPLGEFSDSQLKIVSITAEYMQLFFHLPVVLQKEMPLPELPEKAKRIHPEWNTPQIQSLYLLSDVLKPMLPDDAAALIAFTTNDLYPNEKMNFVFGQASLQDRVGVWSLHRFGDPDESDEDYRLCLLRTLKVSTHETGHMFSMKHCTKYECNMSGSNHLRETDSRPLDVCPECMAKICWGMKYDPLERYEKLAEFCKTHELTEESEFFQAEADAVRSVYGR
ncbi:MAG: archaemetzincin [Planctomycetaceae bacterium]